jgi:hypothetical protein
LVLEARPALRWQRSSLLAEIHGDDSPDSSTGAGVLEVVALADLLGRLVDGVVHLLLVDLADDVERRVRHDDGPGSLGWHEARVGCYPFTRTALLYGSGL